MKKLSRITLSAVIAVTLVACSAEEDIAKNELANDVYQRRIDAIMALDFSTLFSYDNVKEAQQQMPDAFAKVIEHSKRRLRIEKGSTEAVLHVVAANGKCILWAEHYLDRNNGLMVESIHRKEDSHIMYIGARENYPALYAEVAKSMTEYNKVGSYADAATTTAINDFLDKKLDTSTGSAEFRLRVTDSSTEVYVLK